MKYRKILIMNYIDVYNSPKKLAFDCMILYLK